MIHADQNIPKLLQDLLYCTQPIDHPQPVPGRVHASSPFILGDRSVVQDVWFLDPSTPDPVGFRLVICADSIRQVEMERTHSAVRRAVWGAKDELRVTIEQYARL